MSDEMKSPDDLRLPDELAACEARLASEPLAPSRIDRDELLYRAGWAAAGAEATRRAPVALTPAPRKGVIAAWSITSGLLAASLAVVVTHAIMSKSPSQAVEQHGTTPRIIAADAANPTINSDGPRSPQATADVLGPDLDAIVAQVSLANRRPPAAALLAVYERPRDTRWDEPIIVSNSDAPARGANLAPATARGLLHEMLPTDRRSGGAAEGPSSPSLKLSRPLAQGNEAI